MYCNVCNVAELATWGVGPDVIIYLINWITLRYNAWTHFSLTWGVYRSCWNSKIFKNFCHTHIHVRYACFYFIFVHFRLFPVFDFGLAHYASEPFNCANALGWEIPLHTTMHCPPTPQVFSRRDNQLHSAKDWCNWLYRSKLLVHTGWFRVHVLLVSIQIATIPSDVYPYGRSMYTTHPIVPIWAQRIP